MNDLGTIFFYVAMYFTNRNVIKKEEEDIKDG
jgi:hypothetical protein